MEAPPKQRQLALRFISGRYQGGEFPLAQNRELTVGRANELEIVLVEDMVSRKHARMILQGEELHLEDLGSTNGTFVNGEKIAKATLKEGDRILIGTNIIRVVTIDPSDPASMRNRMAEVAATRRTSQVRTMAGTIEEVPLVDLLQLFTSSKKSGVLVLRREDDIGKIYLRKGALVYATINEDPSLPPLKSIYRLLTWENGAFELDPPEEREFAEELNLSTEAILMEGIRQLDELRRLAPELPPQGSHLTLPSPLIPPLRDLSGGELDVLQLALNWGHLETVLNRSHSSDLETCEVLVKLLTRGYLRAE